MQIYELIPATQNMPFYQDFTDENASILIWKYEEEEDYFNHEELIEKENLQKVEHYHPKKLAEYLMVRQLLKSVHPQHKILYKSIGQPYLEPQDAFISISHSFPFAALAISEKRVGIDMEKIQEKILRVKHKFLHHTELDWTENENEVDFLTIIWAVKEALYKLHPCKYWSLKKFYEVEKFDLAHLDKIKCRVFDENFEDGYIANVSKIENYYLAIIEENHQLNYQIPSQEFSN